MERELWKLLYTIAIRLDVKWGTWKFNASDVLGVYFWAVVHDRPMTWALCEQNWPEDLWRSVMLSQSTLSRRMRKDSTQRLMLEIEQTWLALIMASVWLLSRIDGKPLPVSRVSKDHDAAFGRGAGGMQKGYKLHAVWCNGPLPLAWALTAMNVSEKTIARELIPSLPGCGYLLGDSEYDANALYELAAAAGYQLLAPKRHKLKGISRHPQSPLRLRGIEMMKRPFGKTIHRFRNQIERDFGGLTSFGGGLICLPAWVRGFPRVRNWVHAKLLINAAYWFRKHPEVPAFT